MTIRRRVVLGRHGQRRRPGGLTFCNGDASVQGRVEIHIAMSRFAFGRSNNVESDILTTSSSGILQRHGQRDGSLTAVFANRSMSRGDAREINFGCRHIRDSDSVGQARGVGAVRGVVSNFGFSSRRRRS